MIDLLVHESSHVLLFGVAAEEPLTRNPGTERYASPVRRDPRPITDFSCMLRHDAGASRDEPAARKPIAERARG